jgi:two-component system LytT family response regulator
MAIRTILVDDETLAIQGLQLRLQAHGDVEIIDTCTNGREAIRSIKTHKPDLVFLDIQMPGFDGFRSSRADGGRAALVRVRDRVQRPRDPRVRGAGDGLPDEAGRRGPACPTRWTGTAAPQREARRRGSRALEGVLAEHAPQAATELAEEGSIGEPHASNRFEKLINIKDQGQIFRVDVDTIERIDAAGDYMCIQTAGNTLILRETMKDLEKRLDPRRFQRVHRSTIVNLDLVKQVKPHTNGECFLVLESGAQIKVSRSYRDVVARFVH